MNEQPDNQIPGEGEEEMFGPNPESSLREDQSRLDSAIHVLLFKCPELESDQEFQALQTRVKQTNQQFNVSTGLTEEDIVGLEKEIAQISKDLLSFIIENIANNTIPQEKQEHILTVREALQSVVN